MILDSNVIIYAIRPEYQLLRDYLLANSDSLHASSVSRLEVLGYHKLTSDEAAAFDTLFQAIKLVAIDDTIISVAIRLRQMRRRSLGDAIIAATALLYDQPLLTNNTDDLGDIPGLRVIAMPSILQLP